MTQSTDEEIFEEEDATIEKPHIPVQKVSRFGPQTGSKFGK